jgi:hypothetical protein
MNATQVTSRDRVNGGRSGRPRSGDGRGPMAGGPNGSSDYDRRRRTRLSRRPPRSSPPRPRRRARRLVTKPYARYYLYFIRVTNHVTVGLHGLQAVEHWPSGQGLLLQLQLNRSVYKPPSYLPFILQTYQVGGSSPRHRHDAPTSHSPSMARKSLYPKVCVYMYFSSKLCTNNVPKALRLFKHARPLAQQYLGALRLLAALFPGAHRTRVDFATMIV